MATQAQLTANRLNAQRSTGPSTPEGKAASSRNALKSGLYSEQPVIPGESKEDFARLQSELTGHFRPATPEERYQVDKLIRNEWLLRRYQRVEDQLWSVQASRLENPVAGDELGEAFQQNSIVFMRLERRVRAAEKAHKEAMAELTRLQSLRAQFSAQSTEPSALNPELASFRQPDPDPAGCAPPHPSDSPTGRAPDPQPLP